MTRPASLMFQEAGALKHTHTDLLRQCFLLQGNANWHEP